MKLDLKVIYSLNIREKMIIVVSIIGSICYLLYVAIIPDAWLYYKAAKQQYISQKQLVESRNKKVKDLTYLEKDSNDLQKNRTLQEERFFSSLESTNFLNSLEKMASETSNDLKKVRPIGSQDIKLSDIDESDSIKYKKDMVEFVVQGRYDNLIMLFKKISDSQKVIGVNKVELEYLEDEYPKLQAQVVISLYLKVKE